MRVTRAAEVTLATWLHDVDVYASLAEGEVESEDADLEETLEAAE